MMKDFCQGDDGKKREGAEVKERCMKGFYKENGYFL